MKRLLMVLLILAFIPGLYSCTKGEPDKLGSWSQINQTITRPANWQQIVHGSQFKLGERKAAGSWPEGTGQHDYYDIDYGTYPCIDGSTVCVPMAVEFARQHLGLNDEDANGFVFFHTTDTAYEFMIQKEANQGGMLRSSDTFLKEKPTDILLATEPSDEELSMANENKVRLIIKPICYDAFVFIVNKNNPVDSLSVTQIQRIYSGEITNWKEVGGNDLVIQAYQREENSGSQTTMQKQVMQGKHMIKPDKVNIITGMGELVETVGEYQNSAASIGYTFKYYIDTLYKNDNIKVIKVNGVLPSNITMQIGEYPFTTCCYGVIRAGDEDNIGGRFLNWILSDEGQDCIAQAGYCPIS